MDTFTAIIFSSLTVGLLWVLWAGWLARKLPIGEIIDKRRNEKWASQMEIEEHDLPQMIAAANDYRRKRGLPEVTLAELQAQVDQDLRHQIAEQARKQRHAQQTRAPLARERRGF